MLDRCPRYFPLLRFLEDHPVDSILEVGSGSQGLGEFRKGEFVGCDLSFLPERSKPLAPVYAQGEHLPFQDNSFELVICQDTLEHVEPELRLAVVEELLRVSKKLLYLAFPRGRRAVWADRAYRFYHTKLRRYPPPEWIVDHLELPPVNHREIENLLRKRAQSVRIRNGENLAAHVFLIAVEHFPRLNNRLVRWVRKNPKKGRKWFRLLDIPPTYRRTYIVEL